VSTEPVIPRCPNCGAPLELVAGACRWCGEHVTFRAVPSSPEAVSDDAGDDENPDEDPDEARLEKVHDRIDLGDEDSTLPAPAAWILLSLSWVTYDATIQAFLDANPDLLELVRPIAAAVRVAGQRVADGVADVEELVPQKFDEAFSLEEMWTLDLGFDVLFWLVDRAGVAKDTRISIRVEVMSSTWKAAFERTVAKAGDGPTALRVLRATVPRRGATR